MDCNIDNTFNKYNTANEANATYKPIGYYS